MCASGVAGQRKPTPRNPFPSPHSLGNRAARVLWSVVWHLLFRPSPKVFHWWRRGLLRAFGAQIGYGANIHPSVKIWAPWNLEMGDHSCLGPYVDCYNVAPVALGAFCTVSQYSYLCAATHDYRRTSMPLVAKPICLGARSWIAAQVFVGPGVTVGEGTVIGVRSLVLRDVERWVVAAGSPVRVIGPRTMVNDQNPMATEVRR